MSKEENTRPVELKTVVECPIEEAFDLFTRHFDEWWPLASHSLDGGDAETCGMEPREGGRIYERTRDGEEHDWGSILRWDPPRRVSFRWHPGRAPSDSEYVEVTFSVVAIGTEVTVTHFGWQRATAQIWAAALPSYCRLVSEMFVIA